MLMGGWVKNGCHYFMGVDNILECILFVLICTQYVLSSSSYVLYVPKYILSVLPYREIGDFTKREMKLTLILIFNYQVIVTINIVTI